VQENGLMVAHKVIIPKDLRQQVLELLHSGNPGICCMHMLACDNVWWPYILTKILNRKSSYVILAPV
jgi:hypothetical protein